MIGVCRDAARNKSTECYKSTNQPIFMLMCRWSLARTLLRIAREDLSSNCRPNTKTGMRHEFDYA